MGLGDVLVDDAGNFFHYAGQTGKGAWTGPIPTEYLRFIDNG
jgi:hypothetical protein